MNRKRPTIQLTITQILKCADSYKRRHARWPSAMAGPVAEMPGLTWRVVDLALRFGRQGLRGGNSLSQLLANKRGKQRYSDSRPPLTPELILLWADAHFRREGRWPLMESGVLVEAPWETWRGIDNSLKRGTRGLLGKSSLAKLLATSGRKPIHSWLGSLTEEQIRAWADAYYRREHRWPDKGSGRVLEAPQETWCGINEAFVNGTRGLSGGRTLARFLRRHRYFLLRTTYVPIRAPWAQEKGEQS